MKKNYDIDKLDPKPNPYADTLRKAVSIKMPTVVIEYFKNEADRTGIPYQTLINLYLMDCVKENKKMDTSWKKQDD